MNKALFEVLCSFCLDAEPVSCVPYGCGHINETYLTVTATSASTSRATISPS